ncbi:MAG: tryptophan--tRNA ligase [Bacteroidetes bacterium]|nr:tryptophan--tRNA ligase [Bacteroidota bacterium]
MRPTGRLHLGHLVGALENWVRFQDSYETIFGIVDWHALTTGYSNTTDLQTHIRETAADWLAAGIDPQKSIIMLQSAVKEHAELHLLFSMITPTPWLIRNPTLKEQAKDLGLVDGSDDQEMTKMDYGHLGYPVLQSADILVYKADIVPVGEDQVPHIEICREIARRFNFLFGERGFRFPEPQHKLTQTPRLPGTDGNMKMSKSLNNCIYLADDPDTIQSQVKKMVTDPKKVRKNDPGRPEVCSVFTYHGVFNAQEVAEIEKTCRSGELGCVDCKKNLGEKIDRKLAPIRTRRNELTSEPQNLDKILLDGSDRARAIASSTLKQVRKAMNLG